MLEYKTLYEISTLLNSEQDIHSLIRLAVDKVIETTKAQRGVLLVQNVDGDFIFECARNDNGTDINSLIPRSAEPSSGLFSPLARVRYLGTHERSESQS